MKKQKFDIKIMGQVFESDEDGFLDLNAIADAFNLKRPSQWRNKERRNLESDAKLHFGKGGINSGGYTKADEDATIFYAMFISYEFGLKVVQAFRELRQGNVEGALNSAANTMSESSADKMRDMVWDNLNGMKVLNQRTALHVAGIKHPIVFMKNIRKRPTAYNRLQDEGKIVLQTYSAGKWTDRFTQEGFQWLLDNSDKMNDWVEEVRG